MTTSDELTGSATASGADFVETLDLSGKVVFVAGGTSGINLGGAAAMGTIGQPLLDAVSGTSR